MCARVCKYPCNVVKEIFVVCSTWCKIFAVSIPNFEFLQANQAHDVMTSELAEKGITCRKVVLRGKKNKKTEVEWKSREQGGREDNSTEGRKLCKGGDNIIFYAAATAKIDRKIRHLPPATVWLRWLLKDINDEFENRLYLNTSQRRVDCRVLINKIRKNPKGYTLLTINHSHVLIITFWSRLELRGG